jgi:hypothetical protein
MSGLRSRSPGLAEAGHYDHVGLNASACLHFEFVYGWHGFELHFDPSRSRRK